MFFIFIIIIVVIVVWIIGSSSDDNEYVAADDSGNESETANFTCGSCNHPLVGHEVYCPKCKKKINWS